MLNLLISAAAGLILVHAASVASPAEGLWQAGSGGAVIEVHSCGDALCGRVVDSNDLRNNPNLTDDANTDPLLRSRLIKGMDILEGFRGGPKIWTGGRIYDAGSGKNYHAELKLIAPDRLKITGCLVFPLCGSQVWRKAPIDIQFGRNGVVLPVAK
jgi:uncharacterized protein (DUF2147 family)